MPLIISKRTTRFLLIHAHEIRRSGVDDPRRQLGRVTFSRADFDLFQDLESLRSVDWRLDLYALFSPLLWFAMMGARTASTSYIGPRVSKLCITRILTIKAHSFNSNNRKDCPPEGSTTCVTHPGHCRSYTR